MTPSQTTPQPGDIIVAAIEAQTVAIDRAMRKAFWTQIVGLTVIMSVAMTVFVVVVNAG
ncbi:hypothetical protein PMI01_04640 [Caulobacter sp. AP07]|uniref:hypothetical protein n=1 Tax=Caulobacter sp. AP07 TaxID=1144304 RepID=UPI00027225AC|nr:hypothetical protein [Caulobacter sp. AP07]EJL24459.1 hypothetical protein PMI01_04640 [Caulobacter sp. AP07]